jgi:signal transduction histidine kinase
LYALLDSMVCDYTDGGKIVRLSGTLSEPITTRPRTVKRIVSNLVDNALKFSKNAEILVEPNLPETVCIAVFDRGPGIDQNELAAVMQPFYRIEGSRNRETGGTGLGLAIAQQLTAALGGSLALFNRAGGGLEARLTLPWHPAAL